MSDAYDPGARPEHPTARLRNITRGFVAEAAVAYAALPAEWSMPLAGGMLLLALWFGRMWITTGQSRTRTGAPDLLAERVGGYFDQAGGRRSDAEQLHALTDADVAAETLEQMMACSLMSSRRRG